MSKRTRRATRQLVAAPAPAAQEVVTAPLSALPAVEEQPRLAEAALAGGREEVVEPLAGPAPGGVAPARIVVRNRPSREELERDVRRRLAEGWGLEWEGWEMGAQVREAEEEAEERELEEKADEEGELPRPDSPPKGRVKALKKQGPPRSPYMLRSRTRKA